MTLADTIQLSHQKSRRARRISEDEFVASCDEDTRAEWVDGEVRIMSPSNTEHGTLSNFLLTVIEQFAERRKLGRVFATDIQVRLPSLKQRRLPDVLFVSSERLHIITKTHVEGAPDLVMEIVSPDSVARDWREKFVDYEKAGVREYWVIDPMSRRVEAYALAKGGKYKAIVEEDDKIASTVLRGFYLRPSWLWRPLPDALAALKELGIRM